MPDISSRQHPLVRQFVAAARGDGGDDVLLDGWHLVHEAARAGVEMTTVALSGPPPQPDDRALVDQLARTTRVVTVSSAVMDRLSPVRAPAGIVALASRRSYALGHLLTPAPALVVAAHVQDPGNAGAIVRAAEAGGATGVLFLGASADPWGWKALRASMGSMFRVPVLRVSEPGEACQRLRRAGLTLAAAVPRGGTPMHDANLRQPVALLLGSEGGGLEARLVEAADARVSIPMSHTVDSLNVAVAAALLVYEARRQRQLRA